MLNYRKIVNTNWLIYVSKIEKKKTKNEDAPKNKF